MHLHVPWPIGAMPFRVSDFHFPISVFHSLALTLAKLTSYNYTYTNTYSARSAGHLACKCHEVRVEPVITARSENGNWKMEIGSTEIGRWKSET